MHIPVLVKEAVNLLVSDPKGVYVDATVGAGGHAKAILSRLAPEGKLIAFDWDQEALAYAKNNLAFYVASEKVVFCHANFVSLESNLLKLGFRRVHGVLLDLGLSSLQIDSLDRGFSFRFDAPLDMRFDQSQRLTAADFVNSESREKLAWIFREYGEEKRAEFFARKILEARKKHKIRTTFELLGALGLPQTGRFRLHPATKVFMALRIAVNNELANIEQVLPQAVRLLERGGRLVVISFHSLEDRIVKNFFKEEKKRGTVRILTKKVIKPSFRDIQSNPRARSAKLRAVEKIASSG